MNTHPLMAPVEGGAVQDRITAWREKRPVFTALTRLAFGRLVTGSVNTDYAVMEQLAQQERGIQPDSIAVQPEFVVPVPLNGIITAPGDTGNHHI